MKRSYDAACREATEANLNLGVPWYLSASYAYYQLDRPLLSDRCFDELCLRLARSWPRVRHRHRHLIGIADLRAGTCLLRPEAYPSMAIGGAEKLLRNLEKGTRL